ncbi:MAG: hypothetical protein OXC95_12175, partial [Dehalococcoidia bacterium]|nr:hypothetical protein [Dehalococcoidia bacterium]
MTQRDQHFAMSLLDDLRRAQAEIIVTLETTAIPMCGLPLFPSIPRERAVSMMGTLMSNAQWETTGPAFRAVQEWIEAHWADGGKTRSPDGTIAANPELGSQWTDTRFDHETAAKKLILAASLYGAETVAECALKFADHGMIEGHSVYLLKGPSLSQRIRLDDYCTLIPYGEAWRRRVEAQVWSPPDGMMPWPPEQTADTNVCALECRVLYRPDMRGKTGALFARPLTKLGVEPLTLLLGLAWGNGLRLFGGWRMNPIPVGEVLPYKYAIMHGGGERLLSVQLSLIKHRTGANPFPVDEVGKLIRSYSNLSAK